MNKSCPAALLTENTCHRRSIAVWMNTKSPNGRTTNINTNTLVKPTLTRKAKLTCISPFSIW